MRVFFYCGILNLIFQFCLGQETSNLKDDFILSHVDGLKQNSIRSIAVDRNGMTFIATEFGLYSYDGENVNEIIDEKFPNLNKKRINRLLCDVKTGLVYFSTYPENTLYKIIDNKIYKVAKNDGFYSTFYSIVNTFRIKNPLILKKINEFLKRRNQIFSAWNYYTVTASNHTIYFNQKDVVLMFNKEGDMVEVKHSFSSTLRVLKFGNAIILFDKGKAKLVEGSKISDKKIDVAPELADKVIKESNNFNIIDDGNYYYFESKGIVYKILYNNFKIDVVPLVHYSKKDLYSAFYNEKLNIYFLGTFTNGLYIAKPKQFKILSLNDDDKRNSSYSVSKGIDGLWYTTTGLVFDKDKKLINVDSTITISNRRFLIDYKNNLYYDNLNDFINIKTNKKSNELIFNEKPESYSPASSYTYFNNQLFLSTEKEVFYLKNSTFLRDNFLKSKIREAKIFQIKSFNSSILIATTKGVYEYDPLSKHISAILGLENKHTRYIKIIDQNSFWVGCYGDGLFLVKNNKSYKVRDKNIDLTTAHTIEEDKKGNLWITTNDGLLVVKKNEMIAKTLQNTAIECYRFTIEDGLMTNEFNGGCTHPSFRDTDGSLGFPSIKGFVWFFPDKIKQHIFYGNILFNQVKSDGQNINFTNNKFVFPDTAKLISIDFSFPYYFNRENISVEYRFTDSDKWIKIKGNNLVIPRTKSGDRELLLRVRTHGNVKNIYHTQSYVFSFKAKYYETRWFWIGCLFFFFFLLFVSYQIGLKLNKRIEKRLNEIIDGKTMELKQSIYELERTKVAVLNSLNEKDILLKELHHRVKNNLQLIISMLNIQARRNNYSDINEFLQKAETRISSMALIHQRLYQSEESYASVNFKLYIEDLLNSINQTFESSKNKIEINIETNDVLLNISTAIPLGLIVNELFTNSLKYAFPKNENGIIKLSLERDGMNHFVMVFEDNGIGFSIESRKNNSFGLELINLLVKQLKGHVKFENVTSCKFVITFQEIDL